MGKTKQPYDREKAVAYADRWWNDYNPAYRRFDNNDCTNYVSQVLRAGGAPMSRIGQVDQGWWYLGHGGANDRWSYSWSVAHSLRWYLSRSKSGFIVVEVADARELELGDVICYDFDGDGRWQHNTVVTAFDAQGQPLVNAHTENSYHRPWRYEDSPAWTPRIKYSFFHIVT
ncbi:MAG: amidase domain-containing protein [Syntrophomonadaceae bacterium]|nr:amidase domain-containing protein [Syntrophomonadaceae bacterium]